jgi:hypothetical protein
MNGVFDSLSGRKGKRKLIIVISILLNILNVCSFFVNYMKEYQEISSIKKN